LSAAAGEREADDRAGCKPIIEAGGAARGACGKVVAADRDRITGGAVAAAIARTPHAPALLEAWRFRRLFQYFRVGERDVVAQLLALGGKADRAPAEGLASAIDEGIEHDAEELVGQLERRLLRPGRCFARQL